MKSELDNLHKRINRIKMDANSFPTESRALIDKLSFWDMVLFSIEEDAKEARRLIIKIKELELETTKEKDEKGARRLIAKLKELELKEKDAYS